MEQQTAKKPIVEFREITKAFSGVTVLDHVSFRIMPGEVHCLMGENGAGKSTLIKILTGVYHADSGDVLIDGEKVSISGIEEARKAGIGTVFQENSLIPHLSIAENIFLTREPRGKGGLIDYARMYTESREWAQKLGIDIDPRKKVRSLSVAEQQIVEIVKMFSQSPRIVILDEPTSSLSDKEINRLFEIVKRMQKQRITFIYISHRMEEIREIGDRGTVLRDGHFISFIEDVKNTDISEIIRHIVGRELTQQYPPRESHIGEVVLDVRNLTVKNVLHDISFQVHSGEVLGFSGLVGAGRTETAKTLFGEFKKSGGQIVLNGKELDIHSPHDAIAAGIGLLPENRKEEGLFLSKPIAWNISFSSLNRIKKGRFLNFSRERKLVEDYVADLNIKASDVNRAVKYLSGGNQQKVVFAKWLSAGSELYIFDEPTRGIDVGAKREIYTIINKLSEEGHAVIVISSELPEVLGICDNIAVFHEGSLVKTIPREEATQEKIMFYAMGGKDE